MTHMEKLYEQTLPDGRKLIVEAVYINGTMDSVEASVYKVDEDGELGERTDAIGELTTGPDVLWQREDA